MSPAHHGVQERNTLTHTTSLTHTPRSVLEHLELVAAIKGVPGSAACRAAAQDMAGVVGLGAAGDAGALSKNLSGGMKRKLQVGPGAGNAVLAVAAAGLQRSCSRAVLEQNCCS